MRKATRRETEEKLRKLLKGKEVPEFKPDFEKFKREYLDKAAPPTEEDVRRIEEWNAQVRVERTQKVHRVASVVACAVLALTVVTSAIRMGRDSGVVPNPESGEAVSDVSGAEDTFDSATTTTTTDLTWLEKNRQLLEEARTLTGLPLVSAEGMDGFEGYWLDTENQDPGWIQYRFEMSRVYIYTSEIVRPELSNPQTIVFDGKVFSIVQNEAVDGAFTVDVWFESAISKVLFSGKFTNMSVEEAVQMLNALVF